MFDLEVGWWAWLSGGGADQSAVYGTKGQSSLTNQPGGRESHAMAIKNTGELLYVFGGLGIAQTSIGTLPPLYFLQELILFKVISTTFGCLI